MNRRTGVALALLGLAGFDLRVTLWALPPVIPAIHRDLPLSETAVGALTSMPTLLFGVAAIPGALLIARLGARRALVAGLLAVGVAGALRGLGPSVSLLFAMTFLMGAGVAVSQPALPTLTSQWLPARVGVATAMYAIGLQVGGIAPLSLTGTILLPALRGGWEWALAAWSVPVLLTAGLPLFAGPAEVPPEPGHAAGAWWPDFRSRRIWQIGLMPGFATAVFFGVNALLPDYLTALGRPQLIDAALTAISGGELGSSLLVLVVANRLLLRRWPIVVSMSAMTAAVIAMAAGPTTLVVLWSAVAGFTISVPWIMCAALPPLLAAPGDVPRFSAGLNLVQYLATFLGPVIGGAAWDISQAPAAALLPLAAGGAVSVALAATLDLGPRLSDTPGPGLPPAQPPVKMPASAPRRLR